MKRHNLLMILACLSLTAPNASLDAREWTRFRGPNGTGISTAKGIPSQWTDSDVRWKLKLPGSGHSSPVLWEGKVFVTSAATPGPRLYLHCADAQSGKLVWQRQIELTGYDLHKFNTYASATPAVDAKHVYLSWLAGGQSKLAAFDHQGQTIWERNLGSFESQHGSGASPIVYKDMVILAKDPDGGSFVMAFNAADGATRWQAPLRGSRADYGTPCLIDGPGGQAQLIYSTMEDGVLALEPETGKVAWQLEKVFTLRCVSSPLLAGGLIIGSCGSGGGGNYLAAVRPPNQATGRKAEVAYTIRKSAPYVPTSVTLGNLLFLWNDGGIVTCLEAPTGKVIWQERVGGNFFASPVLVDGRIFGVSASGEVIVVQASDTFRELGRYALNETSHATPAVDGGRMYVRTLSHLICVGAAEESEGVGK